MDSRFAEYRINGTYMELYALLKTNIETLEVESQASGLPVRRIRENVCTRNDSIRELDIADSVRSIGNSAFYYCRNLEEVKLPGELQIIESNAFNSCVSLRRVSIPEGTVFIGNRAFYDDRRLEFAQIPASVEFIGNKAFDNCPKLRVKVEPGSYAEAYAKQNGLAIYDENMQEEIAVQNSSAGIQIPEIIRNLHCE